MKNYRGINTSGILETTKFLYIDPDVTMTYQQEDTK
jgi:hypothetical protein